MYVGLALCVFMVLLYIGYFLAELRKLPQYTDEDHQPD